ncbi:MAG: hypothetical protein NTV63_00885 [Candidatus Woesearchaeota archaeon]|nr:hypothetical protein [Candidatus Woesearchaeota archaeon]
MVDKKIPPTVIKYKGIFEISELYKFISRWLIGKGYDFYEKTYKNKPPEIELSWYGEKKLTSYVMDKIKIEFHFYGVRDVEAIKGGEKKKMQDFRVVITFSGEVVTDYPNIFGEKQWEKPFWKKAKEFFETNILKQDLDFKYVDPLYYQVFELTEEVKKFMNMEGTGNLV